MRSNRIKRHKWLETDDLVAFYLARWGEGRLNHSVSEIASCLGMTLSSLNMRIGNFKSLEGEPGLSHFARQSEAVYERYKNALESELRPHVLSVLDKRD